MKITLNVNDELLDRVMKAFEVESKTQAIDLALREADRRHQLRTLAVEGMGMTPAELGDVIDPNYDLMAARVAEGTGLYGRKARSRR